MGSHRNLCLFAKTRTASAFVEGDITAVMKWHMAIEYQQRLNQAIATRLYGPWFAARPTVASALSELQPLGPCFASHQPSLRDGARATRRNWVMLRKTQAPKRHTSKEGAFPAGFDHAHGGGVVAVLHPAFLVDLGGTGEAVAVELAAEAGGGGDFHAAGDHR